MYFLGVAFTINVEGKDEGAADLGTFEVNRPCYLVSTLDLKPDYKSHAYFTENLTPGAGLEINGEQFSSETTYIDTFPVGSLVQLAFAGLDLHPVHVVSSLSFELAAVPLLTRLVDMNSMSTHTKSSLLTRVTTSMLYTIRLLD